MLAIVDVAIGVGLLIVSVVLHENAHGVVARWLGDRTAEREGRLTLNPVKHIDPLGSVILPAALAVVAPGSVFGYAKPVPVNRFNLRGRDRGFAVVALAGPLSNFLLTFVTLMTMRFTGALDSLAAGGSNCLEVSGAGGVASCYGIRFALLNVVLAAFNLVPIPPLDGSRLLRLVLRPKGISYLDRIEPYGFLLLFALIFFVGEPLFRLVNAIAGALLRLIPL